jgi:hypothetical protein
MLKYVGLINKNLEGNLIVIEDFEKDIDITLINRYLFDYYKSREILFVCSSEKEAVDKSINEYEKIKKNREPVGLYVDWKGKSSFSGDRIVLNDGGDGNVLVTFYQGNLNSCVVVLSKEIDSVRKRLIEQRALLENRGITVFDNDETTQKTEFNSNQGDFRINISRKYQLGSDDFGHLNNIVEIKAGNEKKLLNLGEMDFVLLNFNVQNILRKMDNKNRSQLDVEWNVDEFCKLLEKENNLKFNKNIVFTRNENEILSKKEKKLPDTDGIKIKSIDCYGYERWDNRAEKLRLKIEDKFGDVSTVLIADKNNLTLYKDKFNEYYLVRDNNYNKGEVWKFKNKINMESGEEFIKQFDNWKAASMAIRKNEKKKKQVKI